MVRRRVELGHVSPANKGAANTELSLQQARVKRVRMMRFNG